MGFGACLGSSVAERHPCKLLVAGSIPARGSKQLCYSVAGSLAEHGVVDLLDA